MMHVTVKLSSEQYLKLSYCQQITHFGEVMMIVVTIAYVFSIMFDKRRIS
jgi:hypothetical protein